MTHETGDAERTNTGLLATLDVEAEIASATRFIGDYLTASGQDRLVIGLSGGIDSAVVACLAVRAVGPARVMLVRMPYGAVGPSRYAPSTAASLDDAQRVIDVLPGVTALTVNIAGKVDATVDAMDVTARELEAANPRLTNRWTDLTAPDNAPLLGNLKARARADILRCLANQYRGLICGTENSTEHELGYFTLAGDEESDLEVLSPFLKAHVRALARALGVPQPILDKAPSADLWVGQTDEGELGFTYEQADVVLWAGRRYDRLDAPLARRELPRETGLPPAVVERVIARHVATAYKRAPKPTYRSVSLGLAVRGRETG